jgi:hypothetical protein
VIASEIALRWLSSMIMSFVIAPLSPSLESSLGSREFDRFRP